MKSFFIFLAGALTGAGIGIFCYKKYEEYKAAVDEETVRLRSHISQLRTMLETGSPIGRKIDFLMQEFNREANTTGSKCQNSDIAHVVVDLKSEIEKIREQIQNIE